MNKKQKSIYQNYYCICINHYTEMDSGRRICKICTVYGSVSCHWL